MKSVIKLGLLAAAIALAGCSKPVLHIDEPSERHQDIADEVLDSSALGPSRNIGGADLTSTVSRVLPPIRRASHEVCWELSLPAENCRAVLDAQVTVNPGEADPNAFADMHGNVHMHGGIISISGSDDEVAAVLAHEFSHVMYGHVERKMSNALVGMAIAGGLALAITSDSGAYDQRTTEDFMQVGYDVGSHAYSPEMEIEADRTAIYILKRAGYRPGAMRDSIVRLSRMELAHRRGLVPHQVGFLQTHPNSDRRVAHILSAIDDAEAGVPLIVADN